MKRRLLYLAIPAVALAAYVFLVEWPKSQDEAETAARDALVLQFEIDSVQRLEVNRGGQRIVVERDEAGLWWLREPISSLASSSSVNVWLEQLHSAVRYYTVEEIVPLEREADFGLEPESAAILTLGLGDGEAINLRVGSHNPTGGATYYQLGGEPAVQLGSAELGNMIPESYQHLRDRNLFDVEVSDIIALEVHGSADSWAVIRDDERLWHLVDGAQPQVKAWVVRPIVYELATLRVRSYLRDGLREDEWLAYGLGDPAARICWSTAGGRSGCLAIGNETEEPPFAFGRSDENSTLFSVAATLLALSDFTTAELLDQSPLHEDFTALHAIDVTWPDGFNLRSEGQGFEQRTQDGPGIKATLHQLNAITENVFYGLARVQPVGELMMGAEIDFASFLGREPVRVVLHFENHRRQLQLGSRGSDHSHWMQLGEQRLAHQVERSFILRLNAWRQAASQSAEL